MEYFGVVNYLTYLFGVILIILLPGPNTLLVLALSAQRGVSEGWKAAIGIFVGDAILMLATALGAVTLLSAFPLLFTLIKTAGAAYLAYIGLRLLISAAKNWPRDKSLREVMQQPMHEKLTRQSPFKKALVVSLLNPKAILFFFSFFVQFVDPNYPVVIVPFLVLALTMQFFSFVYLAVLIYGGNYLAAAFRRRRKLSAVSSGGTGLIFLLFAMKLATASLLS